jgi:hypothetical protein
MGARRRLIVAVGALALALALAACGEEDFENEPRPAAPIELTALINDREVKVSPSTAKAVGAGLATITISNQSADPATLVLEGPIDDASDEIAPGGTGNMNTTLEEGDYIVSAGEGSSLREGRLEVGPERESAQNELLLP